jgi:hypothetical protein
MARRKSEKEYAIFRKVDGALRPANRKAEEVMATIKEFNERVVEIRNPRNLDRLRAYWAYLRDATEACGLVSVDVLHDDIKVALGYVDSVVYSDGTVRIFPKSIAMDQMPEEDFIAYFRAAQHHIAEAYHFGG